MAWLSRMLPAGRRGGSVGSTATGTDSQAALASWLHPAVPWTFVIGAIVAVAALGLLSAAFSALSWSGSRKNHDLRSVGRKTFH